MGEQAVCPLSALKLGLVYRVTSWLLSDEMVAAFF